MGTFEVRVGVSDGNGGNPQWVDALVDTGATYSVLPASMLLERVGVRPRRSLVFTLATGERKRLPVGEALFRVDDQESTSTVVFGHEDQYLLGATTLQDLALIPDTANHQLIPAPKLLI